MRQILKLLAHLTANGPSQQILLGTARVVNYIAGLGSGAGVESSGEAVVFHKLQATPVIFDVGANKGLFAKLALANRPRAELHCFEPSAYTYTELQQTLKGTPARLNNFAIAAQAGERTLYSDKAGSGLASLTRRDLAHKSIAMDTCEVVRVEALDQYCREHNVANIDLLKVDVEGHEMDVFRGGTDLFQQNRIRSVLFEFGGCNIDTRTYFKDFYTFFSQFNPRRFSRITPSGALIPVKKYQESMEVFFTTNYFVEL
jgi:FkbM family methyltransferase